MPFWEVLKLLRRHGKLEGAARMLVGGHSSSRSSRQGSVLSRS